MYVGPAATAVGPTQRRDADLPEVGWSPADGPGLRKNGYRSLVVRELVALVRCPAIAAWVAFQDYADGGDGAATRGRLT
jgi:hypothetical protein